MNRILPLLVLMAFTTAAQAQFPYLPYNPDENSDGLIGVADLQGLLALYSQEFSGATLSNNGNIAVVEVGNGLSYYSCSAQCASLPGPWSIVDDNTVGLVLPDLQMNGGYAWFKAGTSSGEYSSGQGITPSGETGPGTPVLTDNAYRCFCYAKQRPRVEYSYCSGGDPTEEAFNQCISEKLAEGWYPLSGFPTARDRQHATGAQAYNVSNGVGASPYQAQTHASFWRWEQ